MYIILVITGLLLLNCNNSTHTIEHSKSNRSIEQVVKNAQHIKGTTIKSRFVTPDGYKRSREEANSFQAYLRNLKLKPHGSLVHYYNGATKSNYNVYDAVVDLHIGEKDLHQCADVVMRLRAEYLWKEKKYDKIHFNFTNGHNVKYSKWMEGNRMKIKGNKTWWSKKSKLSNTYQDLWNYLELIFMYAGTASLEKELNSVDINKAQIEDVLIQGGHPGHAVILVDKAINTETGKPIYLLAQSYMPAQEIQVLKNPNNAALSPWYQFENDRISTPEWEFLSTNLKRFEK